MDGTLFVGPAVVVDDKIDDPDGGMTAVVEQIHSAGMPVLKLTALPDREQVPQWRGFALIAIDWDLEGLGQMPAGVAAPPGLNEENAASVSGFIGRILDELYVPVFVLTNEDVEFVRQELAQRIEREPEQIAGRVLVASKESAGTNLLEMLEDWVRAHPAIYAVKRWEYEHEHAKRRMFADFEAAGAVWPRVLWNTSVADSVNAHFELTETISRNILHRLAPVVFDEEVMEADDASEESLPVVRAIIHRRSVIAGDVLHGDVLMPGDFFATDDPSRPYVVNVTPICDLVPREEGATIDDIEMILLPCVMVDAADYSSSDKLKRFVKRTEATRELLWVLQEDGQPFWVDFKGWRLGQWRHYKVRRVGRLLDPYVSVLQERFGLHIHRTGTPRLPNGYYQKSEAFGEIG